MKLSHFAKKEGISYITAYRWWKLGYLNGRQTASGMILIDDENPHKIDSKTK
jgi:putative resolvase